VVDPLSPDGDLPEALAAIAAGLLKPTESKHRQFHRNRKNRRPSPKGAPSVPGPGEKCKPRSMPSAPRVWSVCGGEFGFVPARHPVLMATGFHGGCHFDRRPPSCHPERTPPSCHPERSRGIWLRMGGAPRPQADVSATLRSARHDKRNERTRREALGKATGSPHERCHPIPAAPSSPVRHGGGPTRSPCTASAYRRRKVRPSLGRIRYGWPASSQATVILDRYQLAPLSLLP